jgi:glucokinase
VRDHIAGAFGLPTAFQNDANAAAYGEFCFGAGRGCRSMVLFTLGTGIGGGIILHDRVLEGAHSHGAEIGHIKIEMTNPRPCGCGRMGCLEAYASANSVVKRMQERLETGEASTVRGEFTSRDIFDAAGRGDALAGRIVEETAYYLAVGAMNLMHIIDPEMIVYAGGMVHAGDTFLERIRHHVRALAFPIAAARTEIRYAQLGSDAGLIGAAACGRQLYHRLNTSR